MSWFLQASCWNRKYHTAIGSRDLNSSLCQRHSIPMPVSGHYTQSNNHTYCSRATVATIAFGVAKGRTTGHLSTSDSGGGTDTKVGLASSLTVGGGIATVSSS